MDNFQDLLSSIKDIDTTSKNTFNLNEMMESIDEISFQERKKTELVNSFQTWVENHPNHTFPKKKQKWISGLQSQKNIAVIYIRFPVKEIVQSIKDNLPIPRSQQTMFYYVKKYLSEIQDQFIDQDMSKTTTVDDLKKKHSEIFWNLYRKCVIIVRFSGEECVNILLERGILIQKGNRLYQTRYWRLNQVNNDNKRLLEEYDADDEDMECAKKTRSF